MFTHDHGATASYRTLARGFGCGWSRTYQAAQQQLAGNQALGGQHVVYEADDHRAVADRARYAVRRP